MENKETKSDVDWDSLSVEILPLADDAASKWNAKYGERQRNLRRLPLRVLVQLSRDGDQAALSLVLKEAARILRRGRPLPPVLRPYISASLSRRADGHTWKESFSPEAVHRSAIRRALKEGNEVLLVAMVNYSRNLGLPTSNSAGEPGTAFTLAAWYFDISTSQTRKRYYRTKNKLGKEIKTTVEHLQGTVPFLVMQRAAIKGSSEEFVGRKRLLVG